MVNKIPGSVRGPLDSMLRLGAAGDLSDGQLLDRVDASRGEPAEAAFALLVERHGPMVLRVCRDAIGNPHDAEDACQAVFLVLARRVASVRRRESAASWLFGVARKVSSRARRDEARRRRHERRKAEQADRRVLEAARPESWEELHEEVDRLPEIYRSAVVLCHLEGLTHEEAAARLGCPLRTLQSRLLRARTRLKKRLARRGVVPDAPVWPGIVALASPLPAGFAEATARAVLSRAVGVVPAAVSSLADGVLVMSTSSKLIPAFVALVAVGVAAGVALAVGSGKGFEPATGPSATVSIPAAPEIGGAIVVEGRASEAQVVARGVVVDEAGRPIAGAEVLVGAFTDREARGLTGADGAFSVPIPGGRVDGTELLARSPDSLARGIFRYEVIPAQGHFESSGRIVLKPVRRVAVRVVDATRAPVPGAQVLAISRFQIVDAGATDGAGDVDVALPADASIESIVAWKRGLGFDYAEFGPIDQYRRTQGGVPATEVPAAVTLAIDSARTVQVKASDPEGRPVAGVEFSPWLVHKQGRLSQINLPASRAFASKTDAEGVATFDWLPTSRDPLVFWPRTDGYAQRRAVLEGDATGPVIAQLIPNEAITGRVVRPDGSPAPGVVVEAMGSRDDDPGRGQARTAADGSYRMDVGSGDVFSVSVDDRDWAALPRFDVVVLRNRPVAGVDFVLSRGTLIRGRVTIGPEDVPALGLYIGLRQSGGRALAEIFGKIRTGPEVYRYLNAKTDAEGRYSFRVASGTYTLFGPAREETVTLTVGDESEIVRDFRTSSAKSGAITGRVVEGPDGKAVGGAKVTVVPIDEASVALIVSADGSGNFRAARKRNRLVIHASNDGGRLGAIVEVPADAPEVVIPLTPTATATGLLLDDEGKPIRHRRIDWGHRVSVSETKPGQSSLHFGIDVSTDGDGRFTLPSLVVGRQYEMSLRMGYISYPAGSVRPESPGPVDLGKLRVRGWLAEGDHR